MKTFIRLGRIRLSLTRLKIRRFVSLREEQRIHTFRKKEAGRFTVETNIFDQRYNLLLFVCKTVKHTTYFFLDSWNMPRFATSRLSKRRILRSIPSTPVSLSPAFFLMFLAKRMFPFPDDRKEGSIDVFRKHSNAQCSLKPVAFSIDCYFPGIVCTHECRIKSVDRHRQQGWRGWCTRAGHWASRLTGAHRREPFPPLGTRESFNCRPRPP